MKRIALIAASSIVVLSGTFALAQPQPIPPAGGDRKSEQTESREQRRDDWRQQRVERMKARLDERLGRVREELKLKPEQVAANAAAAGWTLTEAQREEVRALLG